MGLRLVLCLVLCAVTAIEIEARTKVAIVGGGFTGASTAYYLTQLCNDCYEITLFESRARPGGRVAHITIPGTNVTVNTGGDAWSSVNYYLMQLKEELAIKPPRTERRPVNSTGLYLGPEGGWKPLPDRKNDPTYRKDVIIEGEQILKVEQALRLNYAERGNLAQGRPYSSIDEFVSFGDVKHFSEKTFGGILTNNGVSSEYLNQLIEPITRDIYDQTPKLNGFAGMVTLLAGSTPEYSARGGNDMFVTRLLEAAGFYSNKNTLKLNSTVVEISLQEAEGFYLTTREEQTGPFDRVVLACPFEGAGTWSDDGKSFTPITWSGLSLPPFSLRNYHHWYVTWVSAKEASPSAFHRSDGPVPDLVLTPSNSTADFVKLGTEYDLGNGYKAFRFFSNQPLGDLPSRFIDLQWSETFHWPYTFPDLSPTPGAYQPVKLHSKIYYPNALESVAVSMEAGVIGGRNAAMQLHLDLQGAW